MTQLAKTLEIRSSPHIASGAGTDAIMFNVALALLPTSLFAVYRFGWAGLLVLIVAVLVCLLTERLACWLAGRASTLGDWSAAVTGLLYGLTLPPDLPLWMVAVGGIVGVGLGKIIFGGLGYNCFNPALVGRAFLQAAFPAAMTHWLITDGGGLGGLPSSTLTWPLAQPSYDALSGATPLSSWKFERVSADSLELLWGTVPGSTGETSALLILLGGLYLAGRRMLNWRIPVSILLTVAALSQLLHWLDPARYAGPVFMLLSGGLMLGAVFMATDMVASPMTHRGCVLYGAIIGAIVVVIRVWGGMPEGVMYAILLGNAISPHIDSWIQPRVYGTRQRQPAPASPTPAGFSSPGPASPSPTSPSPALSTGGQAAAQVSAQPTDTGPQPAVTPALLGRQANAAPPTLAMFATLLTVGTLCGLAIVSVFLITQPIIRQNQIALLQQAVLEVLPGATTSQAFQLTSDGRFQPVADDSSGDDIVYAGYDPHGQLIGVALVGQSAGYQDQIQIAFGYSLDEQVIGGLRVLSSRETPGLGDRIETDPDFLRNFERLEVRLAASDAGRLENPIEFVKPGEKQSAWQIDGISGATISSRTVAKIVGQGAEYWVPKLQARRDDLNQPQRQQASREEPSREQSGQNQSPSDHPPGGQPHER